MLSDKWFIDLIYITEIGRNECFPAFRDGQAKVLDHARMTCGF